ncbi:MAG TPA: hypothetical protein VFT20_15175 [Candidatus Limnocylindrales bacterium]|nr:hypothetical protein [Candidatus Limnocylindrales bacterium]
MPRITRTALAALLLPLGLLLAACNTGGAATSSPVTSASPPPSATAPASAEPSESAAASPSASPSGITLNQAVLQFEAQNDSGITGGAILTELDGGETAVTIGVVAVGFADPMPTHIHEGTCDDLDPTPKYPLNDVATGASNTVVEVGLDELLATPHAVNIHKSAAEASVYVACAEITR